MTIKYVHILEGNHSIWQQLLTVQTHKRTYNSRDIVNMNINDFFVFVFILPFFYKWREKGIFILLFSLVHWNWFHQLSAKVPCQLPTASISSNTARTTLVNSPNGRVELQPCWWQHLKLILGYLSSRWQQHDKLSLTQFRTFNGRCQEGN